jgi:hypothetical protein
VMDPHRADATTRRSWPALHGLDELW